MANDLPPSAPPGCPMPKPIHFSIQALLVLGPLLGVCACVSTTEHHETFNLTAYVKNGIDEPLSKPGFSIVISLLPDQTYTLVCKDSNGADNWKKKGEFTRTSREVTLRGAGERSDDLTLKFDESIEGDIRLVSVAQQNGTQAVFEKSKTN
ncbi:hypothetical protein JYT83_01005 [bacterium AH-315-F18]|nr:hypothetical protein [bacterium AH-315-F18]